MCEPGEFERQVLASRAADATRVTLDRRATVTYQLLGARFEQLAV
jgi:hypothetical protein